MDRQALGVVLALFTMVGLVGYLAAAARWQTLGLSRRQDQLATAAATLALLLSLGLIRDTPPAPAVVVAAAGGAAAWLWVATVWRRRRR